MWLTAGAAIADVGPTVDWTQLGPVAAILAAVIAWLLKQNAALSAQVNQLHDLIDDRQVEHAAEMRGLLERFAPLLRDATRLLRKTQQGMDETIQRVGTATTRDEIDDLVGRLSTVVDRLVDRE